jgi:hypothetical protein
VWTELFGQSNGCEFFMYMGVAIMSEIKHSIILLDFNDTLTVMNGSSHGGSLVDSDRVLERARHFSKITPPSMLVSDFVGGVDFASNSEHLAQNEYFTQRWWEMDRLDYREDIHISLISAEDTISLRAKK